MPYLALDLDARKKCPLVARACGSTAPDVLWGLTELWQHVWTVKADVVTHTVLVGCVGDHPGLVDALVAFEFLEPLEEGYRVRGAGRWLKVAEGRRRGAAATNAKRWGAVAQRPEQGGPESLFVAPATVERSLPVALHPTPSTQHPTPSIHLLPPPTPSTPEAPTTETPAPTHQRDDVGQEFWEWAQGERSRVTGLAPEERKPKAWDEFWKAFGGRSKASQSRAYGRFLLDKDFRLAGWPMGVFCSPSVYRHRLQVRDEAEEAAL